MNWFSNLFPPKKSEPKPAKPAKASKPAKRTVTCSICSKKGHTARKCTEKPAPVETPQTEEV